jgi:putative nucleotidyltransferase with HDIG domain
LPDLWNRAASRARRRKTTLARLYGVPMSLTSWAAPNAERLLSPLGARWDHVRQVAEQARQIADAVPPADRDLLVAAAYLHDVGYAPTLADTGFHPLDGARWIRDHGPGGRLARLVAHHSSAIYEAQVRGLLETLLSEFDPENSATYDALVFCDLTTGPSGESFSFDERISDIYERYGSDHEVGRALDLSRSALELCHGRTLARLARAGQPMYGSARLSR